MTKIQIHLLDDPWELEPVNMDKLSDEDKNNFIKLNNSSDISYVLKMMNDISHCIESDAYGKEVKAYQKRRFTYLKKLLGKLINKNNKYIYCGYTTHDHELIYDKIGVIDE